MRRRAESGHVLTEFTLLCSLLAAAWLMPWGEHPSAAALWLDAWQRWLLTTMEWIALG
jgi:hypothetical protein